MTNREIYGEIDAYGEPIREDEEYFVCEHCGGVYPEGDRHSSYLGDMCDCCYGDMFG